jgi:UMF1 family MFS transporter
MTKGVDEARSGENRAGTAGRRGVLAWALYGWANTPFAILVMTFVFPAYFAGAIVGDEIRGQALWGYAVAASSLVQALLGPLVGAIADAAGSRKPWLAGATALCAGASALLWLAAPGGFPAAAALALVGLANVGYGLGVILNNAMLPEIVPAERIGRWSGWSWALGYAGGLAALAIMLAGVAADRSLAARAAGPFAGLWLLAFGWPLFAYTPDRRAANIGSGLAIRRALASLSATVARLGTDRNMLRFLVAQMIYSDALVALFAFGGVYAAGVFGMGLAELTLFGVLINVTAGLGSLGFAWVDDWLGSRRALLIALAALVLAALAAVLVTDRTGFWAIAGILGFFIGPPQSVGRSLMARLAPPGQQTEFFGLYALAGRSTAFVGPAVVGTATAVLHSQRIGLASLIPFFIVGLVLLWGVRDPVQPAPRPAGRAGSQPAGSAASP